MDLVAVVELDGAANEGMADCAAQLVNRGAAVARPGDDACAVKAESRGMPFQAYVVALWHRHMLAHAPVKAGGGRLLGSHGRILGNPSYGAL